MKTFVQFIKEATETLASTEAKNRGLVGDGHGDWYDKQGKLIAKTIGGKLKYFGQGEKKQQPEVSVKQKASTQQATPTTQQGQVGQEQTQEEQPKGVVILLGRFNPPSKNHEALLAAGYKILSESSLFLDENFINQNKNNLKIVEYNKFLNKDLYNNLDWLNLKSFYTKSNKKTFCVIHSCTLQMTGTSVLDYIVEVINKTGFINIVDNVFINNIGLPIENKYQNNKYIVTNYSDNTELFEYPTLNKVGTIATNNPDSNILYLHTKGISHINNINYIADWTNMMLYFLVEKHTECINKLNEGYDAVGCNYIECNQYTDKKHFSGNFWWSKSTYINKLHLLDENTGNRAYAEFWLFTNNPSYYNMHSSNIDHYYNPYSIETYSQNSIIQQIISK